ncbi:MAG: LamG domain-containing protein [bacterium]|nr:LamG domain-containing protein [bacterium]
MGRACVLVALLVPMLAQPLRASGAVFNVDSTTDAVDLVHGDGFCATAAAECTLRAATQEANALAGSDTIEIPSGTFVLSLHGVGENLGATGDLDLTEDVTINGAGVGLTILDGNADDRVLEAHTGVNAEILGLTLRNGRLSKLGSLGGGGLRNRGTLTIRECLLSANHTGGLPGAGIYNDGNLFLIDSAVDANIGEQIFGDFGAPGGGLANLGTASLTGSTISNNIVESRFGGAGIDNTSTGLLTATDCTISGNDAQESTISLTGGDGGGIRNTGGIATLTHVTLSDNSGDGSATTIANTGTLNIKNSVIANGTGSASALCNAALDTQGFNLADDTSCGLTASGDRVAAVAGLDLLSNNGGPTDTHALLASSPAIDGADPNSCAAADQRGSARPVDGNSSGLAVCDIGAYEGVGDFDGDGADDPNDNCRFRSNAPFADSGGVGSPSLPDGIGDACQCGDLTDEGIVATTDVASLRAHLADPVGTPLSPAAEEKCSVIAQASPCNILDVAVLIRALLGSGPPLAPVCSAATYTSLAAHWTLDETSGPLADSGPWFNTGTNTGAVYGSGSNGKIAGAMDFSGSARVDVADSTSLRPTGVSVSAWVRADTLGAARGLIAKEQTGGASYLLELLSGGQLRFQVNTVGGGVLAVSTTGLMSVATWTHAVGTYDETTATARIFIDGVDAAAPVSVMAPDVVDHQNPEDFRIGARFNTPKDAMDGLLDDIAVFKIALSAGEVAELFANGPPTP